MRCTGRTRLERLFFIGQHSVTLCIDALRGAIAEAKTLKDVGAYKTAHEFLALCAPSDADARSDKEWVDRTSKENAAKSKRLEDELKGYKNNLIKESIRVCLKSYPQSITIADSSSRWVTTTWECTTRKLAN